MAKQKSRFPSYGLVRGPSHEHGGVAGMVADEQPVELEGGEWIIPKEVVPDYLPVLKQITNEGRAIQRAENGNTAMDALIASASMETGLSQPKSPMYQEGGVIDVLKEAMSQYGGEFDESLYTPEGGRTKLGYAKERGLTPESVAIDTLYFKNPGAYEFLISGETPSGAKVSGVEKSLGVNFDAYGTSKYDEEISKWRATPLKGDVSQLIKDKYGSLYDSMEAHKDFESKIDSAILPKGTNQEMLRQAKIMVRGGMEPDIDRALASLVDIEKNRGAIEAARETAKAAKEKQMMMKALGMNEKEYYLQKEREEIEGVIHCIITNKTNF